MTPFPARRASWCAMTAVAMTFASAATSMPARASEFTVASMFEIFATACMSRSNREPDSGGFRLCTAGVVPLVAQVGGVGERVAHRVVAAGRADDCLALLHVCCSLNQCAKIGRGPAEGVGVARGQAGDDRRAGVLQDQRFMSGVGRPAADKRAGNRLPLIARVHRRESGCAAAGVVRVPQWTVPASQRAVILAIGGVEDRPAAGPLPEFPREGDTDRGRYVVIGPSLQIDLPKPAGEGAPPGLVAIGQPQQVIHLGADRAGAARNEIPADKLDTSVTRTSQRGSVIGVVVVGAFTNFVGKECDPLGLRAR